MPALLSLLLLCLPLITLAQEGFVPLVGVPFIDSVDAGTTPSRLLAGYANAFYIAAISLGAVVAVLKIIWAGVKYMLSDVITDKSSAKADIKGALLGLILIIGAVLLLNTISPNITALQAFNLRALNIERPEMVQVTPEDQCPEGQDYVVTTDNPDGFCQNNSLPEISQDFRDSPAEGAAFCMAGGGNRIYDPVNNRCVEIQEINRLPSVILENLWLTANEDPVLYQQDGDAQCSSMYNDSTPKFDPINGACVPTNAASVN